MKVTVRWRNHFISPTPALFPVLSCPPPWWLGWADHVLETPRVWHAACGLHLLLDSFLSRYYGALHGLHTSLFPNCHLLARDYWPLSLCFCLVRCTVASRPENHGPLHGLLARNPFLTCLTGMSGSRLRMHDVTTFTNTVTVVIEPHSHPRFDNFQDLTHARPMLDPCSTQVWPRFDPGSTQVRPRFDPGSTQVRPRFDPGSTQVRPKFDPGSTKVRPRFDPGLTQVRPRSDPGLTQVRPMCSSAQPWSKLYFASFNYNLCIDQEPILRLLNLQLQRQRCSRLEHFFIRAK
jgi:hypothetical protein